MICAKKNNLILTMLIAIMILFVPGLAAEEIGVAGEVGALEKDKYYLQIGDRLTVKIYPEDEYLKGGEMEVSSEGNITLPHLGKIAVAGKSVIAAQRDITKVLAADYLVNPEVVIEVMQYKKKTFVILGQVNKPGTYEIPPGGRSLTLLGAISMSGGFSDIANIKKIKVMRKHGGETKTIRANAESIIGGSDPDVELQQGDIIHVSESFF